MNSISTIIIFVGITFTLVGSTASIIILCMILYTRLRSRCIKKDEVLTLEGEMEDFVVL